MYYNAEEAQKVCILLDLQVNQWYTSGGSVAYSGSPQVVLLCLYLSFIFLVTHMEQLNYCKIAEILERT